MLLRSRLLSAGDRFACGLDAGGLAWCWGVDEFGNLGSPTGFGNNLALTAVSGGHVFQSLSVGRNHPCGLVASGAAWCWGRNTDGQLRAGQLGVGNALILNANQPMGVAGQQ